jgi:hypothetical protein
MRHKSGRANTGWGVGPRGRVRTPQVEDDLTATNRVMVMIWSPLDLRPTQAIVGRTREGKLNSESAMPPMRNSDLNSVCNQCAAIFTLSRSAQGAPYRTTRARDACKSVARIFRNTGENCQPRLLAVFLAFAAELLELGENGADVEFSRLLFRLRGGRDFCFLARGCLGGRQQGCASIGR